MNRVALTGRLTKDPEIRKTTNGNTVANFTLAVDNRGETSFLNIVAWNASAEFTQKYIKKGHLIGVDGRLSQRSYENNEGKKIVIIQIIADNVESFEKKEKAEEAPAIPQSHPIDVEDEDLPF